jgi:hypothetical protein
MSTVPKGRANRIKFYESRVAKWVENAGEIGADSELVATLQAKTLEARQAYRDQCRAQQAARNATARFNQRIKEMAKLGSSVMKLIHATAETAGSGVYPLASLSPPKENAPIPAPGTPYRFQVDLWPNGGLKLKWKCDNPGRGERTMYQVYRRIGERGQLVYLGSSGKKHFIDQTVPRGAAGVVYSIQATRSTKVGLAAQFNVHFGAGWTPAKPHAPVAGAAA